MHPWVYRRPAHEVFHAPKVWALAVIGSAALYSGPIAITPHVGSTAGGDTVTITGETFTPETTVTFDGTPATGVAMVGGSTAAKAYAFLAGSGPESVPVSNFADGDTITLGDQVYTWQEILTDVPGHLLLGANISESYDIFTRAVVGGIGRGTTYADSTPVNTLAEAERFRSIAVARALVAGTAGNAIPCGVTTAGDAAWKAEAGDPASFLSAGADATTGSGLTCITPAHAAGAVDVVVTNPDTTTWTVPNGFSYSSSPTGWTDIANYREVELRAAHFPGGTAHVRADLWTADSGATVQIRLWDRLNSVSLGSSVVVTGITLTKVTFPVTLTAELSYYKLQAISNMTAVYLFVAGGQLVRGA